MAISFDNSASFHVTSSPASTAFTVSGTDKILIVNTVRNNLTQSITGITYNGVALTKIVGWDTLETWYLLNPTTGANTLTVTSGFTGSTVAAIVIASFNGVDQTSPIGYADTSTGTSGSSTTTVSRTITSTNNNSWIITNLKQFNDTSVTVTDTGSNQTRRAYDLYSSVMQSILSSKTTTTAGSQTCSYSQSFSYNFRLTCIEINPVYVAPVSAGSFFAVL